MDSLMIKPNSKPSDQRSWSERALEQPGPGASTPVLASVSGPQLGHLRALGE